MEKMVREEVMDGRGGRGKVRSLDMEGSQERKGREKESSSGKEGVI